MSRMHSSLAVALLLVLVGTASPAELPEPVHEFDEALVIGRIRESGRQPMRRDIIESRLVEDSQRIRQAVLLI